MPCGAIVGVELWAGGGGELASLRRPGPEVVPHDVTV